MKKTIGVLLLLGSLILTGCCFPTSSEEISLWDNLNLVSGMEDYSPMEEISAAYLKKVTYEITEVTWQNKVGTAQVKVNMPDLYSVLRSSVKTVVSENGLAEYNTLLEKAKEQIVATLESADCPMTHTTVQMEAKKDGQTVILIKNDAFEQVISCNLEELFMKVLMEENADA